MVICFLSLFTLFRCLLSALGNKGERFIGEKLWENLLLLGLLGGSSSRGSNFHILGIPCIFTFLLRMSSFLACYVLQGEILPGGLRF
jgi:hypothetical protein